MFCLLRRKNIIICYFYRFMKVGKITYVSIVQEDLVHKGIWKDILRQFMKASRNSSVSHVTRRTVNPMSWRNIYLLALEQCNILLLGKLKTNSYYFFAFWCHWQKKKTFGILNLYMICNTSTSFMPIQEQFKAGFC